MASDQIDMSRQYLSFVDDIGSHMPGGFFIYKAAQPFELLYANKACVDLFGCEDLDDFKKLTGFTLKGMLFSEDYQRIVDSVSKQVQTTRDQSDYVEYRILRKDGSIRWVDDFGHFATTKTYGGVHYVFISDITEKRKSLEKDFKIREAVIRTLTNSYHTVWLITDLETEACALYHSDADTIHTEAIQNALSHARYTDTKTEYVNTMVAEQDRERMQEEISLPYIKKQLEKKKQFSVNFIRDLPSGERHYRIDFGKVFMPEGKIGVTMGFKDVDEEVRQGRAIQQALLEAKKTEEKNRKLIEEVQAAAKLADLMGSISSLLTNMPAMSFSKDAETGVYLACNQAFAEYAGKSSPDEVVGLTDYEIFDAQTAAHFIEDDKKAIAQEDAYVFFEDVPDATGTDFRNLQTTKSKFRDANGRICLLGMCVDVTQMTKVKSQEAENKAKQEELEKRIALQEELLKQERKRKEQDSMITAMASDYRSVYHVDLDTDDAVCYRADPNDVDQHAEGVHFPFYERFSRYAKLYVDAQYRDSFLAFIEPDHIRNALLRENIISFRYLCKRAGKEYYEMLRMAGVRHTNDRDDHKVHAIGLGFTVIDAEMRETLAKNRALSEALAVAEEASKAKTAFLSNMSHEIRTPMNAIIGLDNLALRDETLSDTTREYLQNISASAKHLLGLINDILDMSRIEAGRLVLRKEEFSFREMMDQIKTMVLSQCADKGLEFHCTIEDQIDEFYIGDDMKLKQVLINILSNAIKFTDAPGSVSLDVQCVAKYKEVSTLRFTVTDTGVGIDEAFLPHLFDPFTQEDTKRSNKYGSTGLGMAITKSLVELMNGTITVTSQKHKGSKFVVVLSVSNGSEISKHGSGTQNLNLVELAGRRILLAEDIWVNTEIVRELLKSKNMQMDHAENGKIAAELFAKSDIDAYDAILMDVRMPEMDGLEATTLIRGMDRQDAKTIPIIAMTANAFDEDMQRSLQVGMNAHLSKPIEPELLFKTLQELIWLKERNKPLAQN